MALPTGRLGVGTGKATASASNYQTALAASGGRPGRIVPSGGAAGPIKYTFQPSGGGGGGGFGGIDYASFIQDFQKRESDALASNQARETEIRGTYDQLIGQGFGAARTAGLAEIERGKTRAVGAGTQQMVASGLYGTTTAASIPVQAENQASLSRLKLEDMLTQRTNQLKLGKAAFVERIEDPYPDYSVLMNAMIAAGKS